jgi:hypothetical protein
MYTFLTVASISLVFTVAIIVWVCIVFQKRQFWWISYLAFLAMVIFVVEAFVTGSMWPIGGAVLMALDIVGMRILRIAYEKEDEYYANAKEDDFQSAAGSSGSHTEG